MQHVNHIILINFYYSKDSVRKKYYFQMVRANQILIEKSRFSMVAYSEILKYMQKVKHTTFLKFYYSNEFVKQPLPVSPSTCFQRYVQRIRGKLNRCSKEDL
jgi:hypothetical protein